MSEANGNGKKNGKNGKKGVNWSGIAALVTAIGGVLGMFLIQDKKGNESEMLQQSTFEVLSARIESMEDRLMRMENMMMGAPAHMMMATAAGCESDEDCSEGDVCIDGECIHDEPEHVEPPPPAPAPKPEKLEKLEKFKDWKSVKEHVQAEQAPVRF